MTWNPPQGKSDFMIDSETMTAHFWADNKEDLKTMLNMQMVSLALGGFKIKCYDVSDVKPEIFGDDE
tara:strand:- start:2107 stop:2307 length:201 start_codon:yes stop_codon:yes gene_type:complete